VAPFRSATALTDLDQRHVGLARLGAKRGTTLRKSLASNGGGLVDLAGQEPRPERAERDEADAEFLEGRQILALGLAPQSEYSLCTAVTAAPHARGGWSGAPGSDRPKCLTLPARSTRSTAPQLLDRNVGIDAVLVEQVDASRSAAA
jgi:hypothetical protein